MIVYRCALKKWAKDITGKGAFLHGGRWNSPGVYMLYTAENNVLAAFEVAMHIPLGLISKNYVMIPIEIKSEIKVVEPILPKNWHLKGDITKNLGDGFVKNGGSLLMKVPSALISDSYNYLINPQHKDIELVKALEPRPILFDKRLMEMIRLQSPGEKK